MTTTPITDNPMVHELYELPAPVVSVYLNPPSPGPGVDDMELRIRAVREELRGTETSPEAREALDALLSADVTPRPGTDATLRPGAAPTAFFIGTDGQTRIFALPGAEIEDQAHCGALPHVLPLLHWRQQHPAYATVMLDRTGAELIVQPAGAAEPVRTSIAGPDDEIERNAPGGPAQPRYQRRAEDSWQHNAGRAAEVVTEALAAARAKLLIVGGDVRAEQYFLDQLPAGVRTDVAIKTISGGRSPDGSEHQRAEQVEAAVREFVDEESRGALERVQDRSGPGGLGVQGPAATVHALARAQVQMLLLRPPEAGADEPEPTTAWFGPQPTDISEHRSGVLVPDGRPAHGPFQEVLARSAVLTDADIRILPEDLADGPARGVGALCRFALT